MGSARESALAPRETIRNHAAFIWSVADLLRGDYKQSEYGKVILPLTVIRRLDCVLEPTKEAGLARHKQLAGRIENLEPVLQAAAGDLPFYNTSPLTFTKLLDDPSTIADSLSLYVGGFSSAAKDVIDKFDFPIQIDRLRKANLLYQVVGKFADTDLHPEVVSNIEMGYLYEELIRRFSELSNETAGEHFTPREVIRLMVNLLFIDDENILTKPGIVKTLCDPACGTGGMLSVAEEYLRELNPQARLEVFGQELNAETYAICRSDMMLKGQDASHIAYGNSFSEDHHVGERFDYLLANPPFGVEWKKVEDAVKREAQTKGFSGRFGAGLPRINDGSFLFLQHMISKMKRRADGGSRVAIVFNGSPLFTGAAGSGESEIRRWIIENDWLEAVVALPDQLFYNTGISTYFWIVTNRKSPERHGKVQLLDARDFFVKMRKSLGEKRKEISTGQIEEITRLYGEFGEGEKVKILPNEAFGFLRITVEQPLRLRWEITDETIQVTLETKAVQKQPEQVRDLLRELLAERLGSTFEHQSEIVRALGPRIVDAGLPTPAQKAVWSALAVRDPEAPIVADRKGNPEPDTDLRDQENVPLPQVHVTFEEDPTERFATLEYRAAIDDYVRDEVRPYVPDAWVDFDKTKVGYEIPLTRHFYKYVPPRPLEEIDAEIKALEDQIHELLAEVTPLSTRVKRLASLVTEAEDNGPLPFISLDIVASGTRRLTINPEAISVQPLPEAGAATVKPGDVLVGKLRPYLAKTWVADRPAYASTELLCLRPTPEVDPRWLGYLVAGDPFVSWSVATSDGTKMPRTSWEKVGQFSSVLPPLDEQQAIAGYLDRETARVDALIAAKRRMVELVDERRRSAFEQALWGPGTDLRQTTTLRRVASRVDVGIAEAATHAYADTGVPLIRSMNIRENFIDDSDLLFIAPWFANRNRSKYARTDDILTVRTGHVGVSALVPERLDHSQCFTQLITTVASTHLPEFVCLALNSRRAREYFLLTGWGSAQANISVPILSGAPIPLVDPSEQAGIAERAKAINEYAAAMTSALRRQAELLEERRRALVTTAVGGSPPAPLLA